MLILLLGKEIYLQVRSLFVYDTN